MITPNFIQRWWTKLRPPQPETATAPEPDLDQETDQETDQEADEETIVARWLEVRTTGRSRRNQSRQFRALRPELARLLIAKHAELAIPGRAGQFSRYLREIRMPRRTAYDLIQRFSPPTEIAKHPVLNDLNCAIGRHPDTTTMPPLDWGGRTLHGYFNGSEGCAVYLRVDAAQDKPHQWGGSKLPLKADAAVCWAMINQLDDPALQRRLHELMLAPQWRNMCLPRSHPRLTLRHQPGEDPLS